MTGGWSPSAPTPARPVVIDCDPGIDDAVSLALAVTSPEFDVRGVTTVAGNVAVDATAANADRLLHTFGCPNLPVAPGAARPLIRRRGTHPPIHGPNGLGGVQLPGAGPDGHREHAVDLFARVLANAPTRSVTVVAIGPLTNIALLLSLRPDLAEGIDQLMIMGGAFVSGNITPYAEFNMWSDPEAAHRVLTADELDVTLIGLDVTRQATVDHDELSTLRAGVPYGGLLADMVLGYGDRLPEGWPLHDALVIAALLEPTLIHTRAATVTVDTGFGSGRGQTVECDVSRVSDDGHEAPDGGGRVQWAFDVDGGRFRELLLERLAACDRTGQAR